MKQQCIFLPGRKDRAQVLARWRRLVGVLTLLMLADTLTIMARAEAVPLPRPSRSTTLALTRNDRRLVVVNRETNSVSVIEVIEVVGGVRRDAANKLAEIAVGQEPRCVAIHPNDQEAYVTNTASGIVSVLSLVTFEVVAEIPVGTEPRGCAITPNGTRLYVANHTEGTVSGINVADRRVVNTISVNGNPSAIAITNDLDEDDADERVFVTDFYARIIPGGPGEAFDDGKQGRVFTFPVNNVNNVDIITLSPLANSGFRADRTAFCTQTATTPPHSNIFCPDTDADPGDAVIVQNRQAVFPNQFQSALIRGRSLYLPNIGAQPEPPIVFNVNVQALVHLANTETLVQETDRHVNLNAQVALEVPPPNPTQSIRRLFGNDLVDIDATADNVFLIVSRGGNFVFRATLDTDRRLDLGAPSVIRFRTGNLPNGIVTSVAGGNRSRAYVNNEVNVSVTAINLFNNTVIERDIPSGTPPAPGTFDHGVLLGKLAFFTALGVPDNGLNELPIRDIVPLLFRGKASNNAWSSCGSCHPDGLADGVTWIFATGPRQTVPLDGFFAKDNPADQRISNWSTVMGSITDFNNNSRGVQGGCGFASAAEVGADPPDPCSPATPANPDIFQHGLVQGASDALDFMTLWVQTVRAPILPLVGTDAERNAGRTVFRQNCATCHGGAKWTKSQILYANNPTFDANPAVNLAALPRDPGVSNIGVQIESYTVFAGTPDEDTLQYLEDVETFDATDPLEIRATGATALGVAGFNVPALLGLRYHGPYLHNGEARNIDRLFELHALGAGTIESILSVGQLNNLRTFLLSIDGSTRALRSDADRFRDGIAD